MSVHESGDDVPDVSIGMKSLIIDSSPVGMMVFDVHGKIVFANNKVESIFSLDEQTLVGKEIKELIPQRFREYHKDVEKEYMQYPLSRSMGTGRDLVGLRSDGFEIPLEIGLSPINYNNKRYILASVVDITDRVRMVELELANERLEKEAAHDSLTGLANRRMLFEFAENLRLFAIRNQQCLTLMFLDLDGFKAVNDQYGHAVGDSLLCDVAKVLTSRVRQCDIVGRYGGDEFVICFVGNDKQYSGKQTAKHIIKGLSAIRDINGYKVSISASVGVISSAQPEAVTISDMIDAADQLMYKAKKEAAIERAGVAGINRIVVGELRGAVEKQCVVELS